MKLERGRLTQANAPLEPLEFDQLRSLIYKFNWLGKESRPEAAGVASILASRLNVSTVTDIKLANKLVNTLRESAKRAITLWSLVPRT